MDKNLPPTTNKRDMRLVESFGILETIYATYKCGALTCLPSNFIEKKENL
jgi:hypothetical protein